MLRILEPCVVTTAKSAKASKPASKRAPQPPVSDASEAKQIEEVLLDQVSPERIPSDVPHIYADIVTDVQYGINTTKVVFAIETGRNHQRNVGVLTIPTTALLVAAGNILSALTSQGVIEETAERYKASIRLRAEMRDAIKGD